VDAAAGAHNGAMPIEPSASPRELAVSSSAPEQRYELDPRLVAPDPDAGPTAVRSSREAAGGPVYRRRPSGDLVVPTGRVLVRFGPGQRVEEHRSELSAAGYTIDAVLSYAPHTAWVRATSGRTADALGHLDALGELPGVEHVEPQMIGEAARRS
jgi:hypothetical protein